MADSMFALADELRVLRGTKDTLNANLKECNRRIEEAEAALAELMVSEEVQNFTRDGYTFYLLNRVFASAVKDRKEELYEWLKTNNFGGLVKETVNANSLRAFIKEQMEDTDELPEGLKDLVNVYEKTTVGLRAATR